MKTLIYGGGNVSFILTELFPSLKDSKIDFLKLRAALGQTGNDAGVYRTSSWFEPYNSYYTYLPIHGVLGLTEYNRLPSQSLKPEITTEYEFGVQGNFFDNRVRLDFAYYNKRSKDQIINATLAPETGYTSETRNVGELENKGIELAAGFTPIRSKDWQWDVNATFTKNTGKVIELWDGLQEYNIYSWRGIEYRMKVGEKIGTFQVPSVDRVTDKTSPYYGYMIVNTNGFPTQSTTEKEVIGSSQPDFILGLNTSIKFKDFRLTVVGDWHKGGWMASNTSYITHFNGNSTQTVYNERNSFIYPNSVKIVGGQYVENNIPVMANQMNYTLGNYSYNPLVRNEMVIPKDFFKIREVTLSYDLPKKALKSTPLSKVTLSFIGRNLFLFTPKKNNYVDPEVANMGNDLTSEFGEISSGTSYRSFGGAIKVEF